MRVLTVLTAAVATAALLATSTANASTNNGVSATASLAMQVGNLRQDIAGHRSLTWRYEDRAGVPRTRTVYAERHTRSVPFLRWIDHRWMHRASQAKRLHPRTTRTGGIAHLALWLCIHRGEGAWTDDTGNGYYGGLQMTAGWGGLARPDLVSPYVQMATAEREYRASGYSHYWLEGQWPNTSPPCMGYA